ncbi:MAG: hypothetical protein LBR29_02265 [Methylobacteriaceae bacterium]|nr:hypothetical protein [Methylobacteriaceae bacterium]
MNEFILLNSANYITPEHAGRVILCGSHGGLYSAFKAVSRKVRAAVFSDAAIGKDGAGIASLAFCDPHALPVAVIDYMSARIGDAADMLERGRVSRCNRTAGALGVDPGMTCAQALELLSAAAPVFRPFAPVGEHRSEVTLAPGGEAIVCLDSASLILPEDAGRVVVTGSHGGLIGGATTKAINVPARLAVFNDAGGGMDDAGAGRLKPLDAMGIGAVLVDVMSARIGDALSTLNDGVISRVNRTAAGAGVTVGRKLSEALRPITTQQ